jgi:branched-chain amino acid transport system permease protein
LSVADFIVQLINALSQASMLFLLGAGLALIFGIMRVVNFAHGAFYMLGAYAGCTIVQVTGSFWLAITVAPVLVMGVGLAFERSALRLLYKREDSAYLLVTFGLSMVMIELVRLTWGVTPLQLEPPELLQGASFVLGDPVPHYRVFLIVCGLAVALLLWSMLERTRLGLLIRATSQNVDMVQALGVNVTVIRFAVFGLGCGLAALGGALAAPLLTASLGMANLVLVDAFIIVIIGGMGSFLGAILGSLIVAFVQIFGVYYFPDFAMILIYAIMVLVLVVRPGGLLGKES